VGNYLYSVVRWGSFEVVGGYRAKDPVAVLEQTLNIFSACVFKDIPIGTNDFDRFISDCKTKIALITNYIRFEVLTAMVKKSSTF
jgi:hypothetical protein